jgi:hypothetical protein
VDAGIVDNEASVEFDEAKPGTFVIVAETRVVSRDQYEVVGPHVDAKLVDALGASLTGIDELEEAEAILLPGTNKLEVCSGEAKAELEICRTCTQMIAVSDTSDGIT